MKDIARGLLFLQRWRRPSKDARFPARESERWARPRRTPAAPRRRRRPRPRRRARPRRASAWRRCRSRLPSRTSPRAEPARRRPTRPRGPRRAPTASPAPSGRPPTPSPWRPLASRASARRARIAVPISVKRRGRRRASPRAWRRRLARDPPAPGAARRRSPGLLARSRRRPLRRRPLSSFAR